MDTTKSKKNLLIEKGRLRRWQGRGDCVETAARRVCAKLFFGN